MMKKVALAVALLVCACAAQAAWLPDLGSWTYNWDFDDGPQGWSTLGTGAAWIDQATNPNGPVLPDGSPSGAGGGNWYLPNGTNAYIDISAMNLGNGAGKVGFQVWADVYIPNLKPLTGLDGWDFDWGYPGNQIHRSGLAVVRADMTPMYVGGKSELGNLRAVDKTWDNTTRTDYDWNMEEKSWDDLSLWWDDWVTLVFDYNYTSPGKWNAAAYIPWQGPYEPAGWHTLAEGIDCNPDVLFTYLCLGKVQDGTAWTQAQFDNVYLKTNVVPEPGSMLALSAGLLGLFGVIRRKK